MKQGHKTDALIRNANPRSGRSGAAVAEAIFLAVVDDGGQPATRSDSK